MTKLIIISLHSFNLFIFCLQRLYTIQITMISDTSTAAEFCGDSASVFSQDSSVFFSEPPPPTDNPLDFFIINVGGSRYILSQELLASHPETRLGKLALSTRDSALDLCDDADFLENEYFFDRNSQTFQYIMNFYKTGHLHVREELCVFSFLQEIEYWGIDEFRIDHCCRDKYYRKKEMKESIDIKKDVEMNCVEDDFSGVLCEDIRRWLWDLMEKPDSSKAAKTYGTLSMFFVIMSIANMAMISLDFTILGAPVLDILEYICIVWFTGDLVLRFMCVKDKCKFSRSVVNIIDLLAILPFYITLAVENLHGGSTELENVGRVVQVLRLMRSLRMLKLGRHSTGNIMVEPCLGNKFQRTNSKVQNFVLQKDQDKAESARFFYITNTTVFVYTSTTNELVLDKCKEKLIKRGQNVRIKIKIGQNKSKQNVFVIIYLHTDIFENSLFVFLLYLL